MLLRSLLFVPGNSRKMLAKALGADADAIIADLEDSVPASEKGAARESVGEWLREVGPGKVPALFVRVSALRGDAIEFDLETALCTSLAGVCLPKVESAEEIEEMADLLRVFETGRRVQPVSTRIIALIETARGVMKAHDIARASPRVIAVAFGAEDYALDMGTQRSGEGTELFVPRSLLAIAARAAGVGAIDMVHTDLSDEDGLLREVRLARQLGFGGKLVIHPKQLGVVNAGFLPSEEEVAYARRVIAAYDEAESMGSGAISLDGKMVDMPVVQRARRIVDLVSGARREAE